jgi:hypothetical protein
MLSCFWYLIGIPEPCVDDDDNPDEMFCWKQWQAVQDAGGGAGIVANPSLPPQGTDLWVTAVQNPRISWVMPNEI